MSTLTELVQEQSMNDLLTVYIYDFDTQQVCYVVSGPDEEVINNYTQSIYDWDTCGMVYGTSVHGLTLAADYEYTDLEYDDTTGLIVY